MNFFTRRRYRKIVKHALHEAHHARHMRGDIATPEELQAVIDAERKVQDAWQAGNAESLEQALDGLGERVGRVYPPKNHPRLREHVEILAVALSVAMAFRAYFIQPFKIPTGSMQPTLYGITVDQSAEKTIFDTFPLSIGRFLVFGERYQEFRSKVSGTISRQYELRDDKDVYFIGGVPHALPHGMNLRITSPRVEKGQLIAAGRVKLGDHIFVNKVKYNYSRPERGNIFVFSTDFISHPQIKPDTFYIKRLAGMPGETISIDPPYLVADGKRIEEPFPFYRMVNDRAGGYVGYYLPQFNQGTPVKLASRESSLKLADDEYLPLGDNTRSSLDGRYFGGVREKAIVGPAFMVYWPFGRRWGLVE